MRRLAFLFCLISSSLFGQTFQNGFNFYLPPYDSTSQLFFPDFPVEPIGPNDFVTVNDEGNFEINGKPFRIYGNNIWSDPGLYPDKDKAPFLAARLRKFGFNAIRIHTPLNAGWGLKLLGGPDKFNEDRLDKFFFFVNELKKQGIRIVLSWNFEIAHTSAEGVQVPDSVPAAHAICDYYDRKLIEVRKSYLNYFVNRVNPYTGLAMKNDPVMALIEVVNENWLFLDFLGNRLKPIKEGGTLPSYYNKELDNFWNKYLLNKYGNDEALKSAWHTGSTSTSNMLQDISFENSTPNQYWKLMVLDAANANLTFKAGDGVSGNKCGRVTITNSTGTDWHVQFYQNGFPVYKDTTYQVKFWAKADVNRSIVASLSKLGEPYTIYGNKQFNLTTVWQEYSFNAIPGETNTVDAYLSFSLGANAASVYFDNMSLTKFGGSELLSGESLALQNIKRFQNDELKQFGSCRKTDEVAFYIDLQEKYFDEFYSFMKNECNIRIPISGQNFLMGLPDNKIQSRLDYIDNHNYWKLPLVDKTGKLLFENKAMVNDPEGSTIKILFRGIAFKNKPFAAGEYNHSYFTDYYIEAPFFLTAYSSLHDADAMMYFAYACAPQPIEEDVVVAELDMVRNNIQMAFAPSFSKAFRDKLITVSTQPIELKMTNNDLISTPFTTPEWELYTPGYPNLLGLIHKVVVSDYNSTTPFSENIIPAEPTNPYTSDTKELEWDKNGIFTINAPKFIAAVGFLQNYPNKEIGIAKMISGNTFGGFTWISLTNDNLDIATKSLLTIGTKQENTNTVWNADKSRVLDFGKAPTIIEPARLSFELAIKSDSIRVHQLGTLGEKTGRFKVYKPISANKFRMDIDQTVTKTLWFGIETKWTNEAIRTALLLQPNGGEQLETGTVAKIKWETVNVEHLSIWFSTNSGTNWNLIAANVDASLKEYYWTVPEIESSNCLIKISADDNNSVNDFSNSFFSTYTILKDNLLMNGNFSLGLNSWGFYTNMGTDASFSVLEKVSIINITNGGTASWHVQLTQSNLKIERGKTYDISFDASASRARTITVGVGQDGGSYTSYFSQSVSLTTVMKNYQYRFTMNSNTDNNARFAIDLGGNNVGVSLDNIILKEHKIAKTIAVTSPKSSDIWKVNKRYDITWASTDINKINISYNLANQNAWTAFASNITATLGKYSWNVPLLLADSCQIKLEDAENAIINAVSPKFFIKLPSLELTSPKADNVFVINKSYDIIWTSSDVNKVNLYYKLGNAVSWIKFGNNLTASTGKYSWTVPVISASDSCQIKIENAEITSISAISPKFYVAVPAVEIISPTEGETLKPDENYEIEWRSQFIDKLNLYYKTWNASAWIKLGDKVDASISDYSWTVPEITSDSCQIKAEDYLDASINVVSSIFYIKDLLAVNEYSIQYECFNLQNYPNPFNLATTIKYSIPVNLFFQDGNEKGLLVTLAIYNSFGKEVETLVDEFKPAGNYEVPFNAGNLAGGIYLCKLTSSRYFQTRKLLLIK